MGQQERVGRYCPRECGYRLNIDGHNAKSEIDGKQICPSCKTAEIITRHLQFLRK